MWMTPGCSLPNDDQWIARRMRCDADTFERVVKPVIEEFFRVEKGRLFSPRLMDEYQGATKKHKKYVEAGKKGGRPPKSLKTNEIDKSQDKARPKPGLSNQNQNHIPPKVPQGDVEKLRDTMWKEWPPESRKRTSKSKFLEKLTAALKRDGVSCDDMLSSFRHWLRESNTDEGGKYLPNPEPFFNKKFYLDHLGKGPALEPIEGGRQLTDMEREVLERQKKREGPSNSGPVFLAAGGMR